MSAAEGTSDGAVRLAVEGPVARITIDRPAARNAMTPAMYDDLAAACATIGARPEIRVAVLRGAGGAAFVAGTDIAAFRDFTSGEDGIAYEARMEAVIAGLEALPMPTIAIVEGWAVGGGLILANACDLRLAAPGARFGVPIARTLGNGLSAANLRRLSRNLGPSLVARMLLAAETPTAEELPPGYVEIAGEGELEARLEALCERLCGHAPLTMRAAKEALRRLALDPAPDDGDLVRLVYGSADFREGVAAFVARRKPVWRGE